MSGTEFLENRPEPKCHQENPSRCGTKPASARLTDGQAGVSAA
ncbi:hypothetical protein ACIK7D_19605 [Agrobacterium sp. P15N1-A]